MKAFPVALTLIVVASVLAAAPLVQSSAASRASIAKSVVSSSSPTSTVPFFPNIKITDGTSPYDWQVEPTMVVNKTGTVFVGWKETNGPEAAGYRVGSSFSTDQGTTWAKNILMNQTHPNQNCRDSDPWMSLDPNDRVHFAYLEYDPNSGSSPPCNSGLDVSNTTNGQDWGRVHYIQGLADSSTRIPSRSIRAGGCTRHGTKGISWRSLGPTTTETTGPRSRILATSALGCSALSTAPSGPVQSI